MASEWPKFRFQTLIDSGDLEIGDGYRAKNSELGGHGPIFLRAGHVRDTHIDFDGAERFHSDLENKVASKMSRVGDVIITTKGNSTGRASFVTSRMPCFIYSPHLSYWRSKNGAIVSSNFLRFWAKSTEFKKQLAGMATSTDMAPYLSLIDQKRLIITLPPINDQVSMANVLGALEDRIHLIRSNNQTLEAIARAIFKSWFVDFDPVRAKAEGREPEGMDAATASLFPSALQDSELGPIPEGWSLAALNQHAALNPEIWSKSTRPEVLEYVDLANTKWGSIESITSYAQADAPSRAQRVLRVGDSIVGTVRPGNGSYALIGRAGLTGSTGFAVLRPKQAHLTAFTYLAATAPDNVKRLSNLADGGAYPAVRPEAVISTSVVTPHEEILRRFADLTDPLLKKMTANEQQASTLSDMRDTLLPRLISGKLRVPEAEAMLAEVI